MARRYVPVAEVARPHGVQGELRLKIFNRDSNLLVSRLPVKLRLPDGAERDATIVSVRGTTSAVLVKLSGVDDRDAAEALRGAVVLAARDAFPPLDEGEFYACDIEGAKAVLSSGEELGRVVRLQSYPTCDALVIERVGNQVLEVPLLDTYIASVDVERGVVEILSLEGLV